MTWEIATVIVLLGSIAFMSYFAKNLDENHWYLKLGFFLVGFYLILTTIAFGQQLASDAGASENIIKLLDTSYIVMLSLSIFVTFYVVIMYGFKAATYWTGKKDKNDIEDFVNS